MKYLTFAAALVAIILALSPGFDEWQSSNPKVDRSKYHIFGRSLGLAGQLHLPDDTVVKPPVIVVALGLGLVQESQAMQNFVDAYKQAGFAVFTFDYATFGASLGLPRHQVHPQNHIRDLNAAIAYVKTLDSAVDVHRVGLWGSSLGGGHVLMANDKESVRAVVSLVPHVASGFEGIVNTVLNNPGPSIVALCSISAALLEAAIFSIIGKTTYIPLHGEPGSAAMMQNPGDDEGYGKLVANTVQWNNAATVSSVLAVLLYRPLNQIETLTPAATLIVTASDDTLCSAAAAKRAAQMMEAQYLELPHAQHFDIYDGKLFEEVVDASISFYKKHL